MANHTAIPINLVDHPVSHYRFVVCFQITKLDDTYTGVRTWFYNNEKKLDAFVCDNCKEKRKEWIYQAKYPC